MNLFQHAELNQLVADLSHASNDIRNKAYRVTESAIQEVAKTGAQLAPRDTEATALSIDSEMFVVDTTVIGEAGPTTRQAVFMEWGTYKDAPQSFMGPALDRHSGTWEEQLADEGADI